MTRSINQLIHGHAEQSTFDEAFAGFIRIDSEQHASKPDLAAKVTAPVAFGGIVDLVRSTAGRAQSGEICEECKTLNRRSACYCRTCMHKLPAYFASANPRTPLVLWHKIEREENRTSAWDLAAVWAVLISLVLMTANIPVG